MIFLADLEFGWVRGENRRYLQTAPYPDASAACSIDVSLQAIARTQPNNSIPAALNGHYSGKNFLMVESDGGGVSSETITIAAVLAPMANVTGMMPGPTKYSRPPEIRK